MGQKLSEDEILMLRDEFWTLDRSNPRWHEKVKTGYFKDEVLMSVVNGLVDDLATADSIEDSEHGLDVILELCQNKFIDPHSKQFFYKRHGSLPEILLLARSRMLGDGFSFVGTRLNQLIEKIILEINPDFKQKALICASGNFVSHLKFNYIDGDPVSRVYICSNAAKLARAMLDEIESLKDLVLIVEEPTCIYFCFQDEVFMLFEINDFNRPFEAIKNYALDEYRSKNAAMPRIHKLGIAQSKDMAVPTLIDIF